MERWFGKVAVVTGASSGIGLATSKALVEKGMIVVGLARRKQKMDESMREVKGPGQFHSRECDITKEENVNESLNWVKNKFGTINVLVNNAGTVNHKNIQESSTSEMEHTIRVNLMGPLYCSKESIRIMKENEKEGHIINVNSVLGHRIPPPVYNLAFNIYPATKFALRALSETLKNELTKSAIRVTNISPGLVKTQMMDDLMEENKYLGKIPALEAEDVASSILHALSAPTHVEISEITLTAKDSV